MMLTYLATTMQLGFPTTIAFLWAPFPSIRAFRTYTYGAVIATHLKPEPLPATKGTALPDSLGFLCLFYITDFLHEQLRGNIKVGLAKIPR